MLFLQFIDIIQSFPYVNRLLSNFSVEAPHNDVLQVQYLKGASYHYCTHFLSRLHIQATSYVVT
jgi:hypothetical protein